jgi:soluble lytic murein transglycosylase-like protein
LPDLAALRRAEALAVAGDLAAAWGELAGPAVRESTNRLILERAGRLAAEAGDHSLAGDLYARGAPYFGWTAERSRMYMTAGASYRKAGLIPEATAQYRRVVELFSWTAAADIAGEAMAEMGTLPYYHHGLIAHSQGQIDQARASLEAAAEGGPYASAALARLRAMDDAAAWLAADAEGTPGAYRDFAAGNPESAYAAESRFQEGFTYYLDGSFGDAAAALKEAAGQTSGDAKSKALLWMARALEQEGRTGEARQGLEDASAVVPAGYYAVRARDLLAGTTGWASSDGLPGPLSGEERSELESWIEEWAGPSDPDPAAEVRARRGLAFAALDMRAEAQAELNAVIAESDDPRFLLRLALDLNSKALWTSSSRAAGRVAVLSPWRAAVGVPRGLQRLLYPVAYPDEVTAESRRYSLDPLLLLSLIHQESRYDPLAISYADARGLTQVMPATGAAVARALGIPDVTADDLYTPSLSVRLGAFYLAEQVKTFDGDLLHALAAYNAGAGPVPRWSASDPDLFVERIGYSQTREYVRQIYLHYSIYRSIYSGPLE